MICNRPYPTYPEMDAAARYLFGRSYFQMLMSVDTYADARRMIDALVAFIRCE